MSAHTPGPWKAGQSGDDYVVAGQWAGVKTGRRVMSIRTGVIPSPADARLIVAAPRMLVLLEHVPHNNMTAAHNMIGTVAGCPGCEARAILHDVEGESNG